MPLRVFLSGLFFLFAPSLSTQAQNKLTIAERLGYDRDTKLLIIHADDLASAHAENMASFDAMDHGCVNSASVMVPCPWLMEVVDYAKRNAGQHDLGLHLTVTCEWKNYKWGPAAPYNQVSSLVDDYGYFHADCAQFAEQANLKEVETELRAQITKAIALGLAPTHLDSHMGCLFFTNPDIFEIYLKLGREFGLPTYVDKGILALDPDRLEPMMTERDIRVDATFSPGPDDYAAGMDQFYERSLRSLEAGLNIIIIHAAYDNEEMQAITVDHPDWGAAWRQADYDFFASETCREIIREENIQLVTWRDLGRLLRE